ncbi:hypothetical protein P9D43_21175, partial [Neobacillus niacini]|uniref:hypothetical protein n=1 Tax=Neobacillus niacini TaxID=86668 RepID=UPI002DBB297A
FLPYLVRSSHDFGLYLAFYALPCPKFTRLRTLPRFFRPTLSEVHTTSDGFNEHGWFFRIYDMESAISTNNEMATFH